MALFESVSRSFANPKTKSVIVAVIEYHDKEKPSARANVVFDYETIAPSVTLDNLKNLDSLFSDYAIVSTTVIQRFQHGKDDTSEP